MVSIRCKMIVKAAIEEIGLPYSSIYLGEANIQGEITPKQREQLRTILLQSGLELMDSRKAVLVEKIKLVIIEMIYYADELPVVKNSVYISDKLNHQYTYLANLFSEVTGITIEQHIITHKIERVKELIMYDQLTLTEIANKLGYSSVSHLSTQFKKTTGLTPSYFKQLKRKKH
jgi:YesN/AraC family two-component response regulator